MTNQKNNPDHTPKTKTSQQQKFNAEDTNRTIVASLPAMVFEVDQQGQILYSNSFFEDFSYENVVGKNFCDLVPPECHDEIIKALEKVFAEGFNQSFVYRDVDSSSAFKWYQATVSICSSVGEKRALIIINDVTNLVQLAERKHSILNSAMSGFALVNSQGIILDVNEACCHISGYSKQELLGMYFSKLDVSSKEKQVLSRLQLILEQGEDRFETKYQRKDGTYVDIELSIQYHPVDGGQFVVFLNDITERKSAEEALLRSEGLLKSVMELLPVGVWIFNSKGEIVSGNAEGKKIWEGARYVGPEDYGEYKGWWLNTGKLIEPHEWSAARAIQKGEISIDEEIEIECFDGTHKIILNSAVPILNSDGEITGAIVTNQDITSRKEAERRISRINHELEGRVNDRTAELQKANAYLQQTEEKYRTVADYNFGWEYWTDPNGNFIYCSPSCQRITGYPVSAFLEKPALLQEIIYPDDLKLFTCHRQNEQKGKHVNQEINFRICRADGAIRWMGHVCQPIFDKDNNFVGNRGSNRDITEKILAQQQLKTSNRKYQLLSENISDGIFICRDGLFEYVNKAFCETFGYPESELIGNKLTQLIAPEYLDELEIFHALKIPVDRSHNIEVECIRKDFSRIFIEFLFNFIGNELLIYGVARDITEKKLFQKNMVKAIIQTEEKERSYFSKELHDGLGPLLSAIKLYLQWSERANTEERRKEIIQKAEEILDEALHTAKEISNKLSPHLLSNHGLNSAIQSFVSKLQVSTGIQVTFNSDLKRRLKDEIEAAIYRATTECLNNTIKYGEAKNISIMIMDADSQLFWHYTDDGVGFNFQETLAQKKGLGLFNLQNRIQTIGGMITMFSEPGRGVDYRLTINL